MLKNIMLGTLLGAGIALLFLVAAAAIGPNNNSTTSEKIISSSPEDTNPQIGDVILFASNFAPRGWAFCHGQLLPIAQNTALFSILGTTYGGDGRTTFGLPDLRGRVPISPADASSRTGLVLGQHYGTEEIKVHSSTVNNGLVSSNSPKGILFSSQKVENRQPYLGMNYIICLYGTYPSRN